MASTGETWRLGRRPALDGLRGIAALVVVAHHILLIDPTLCRWHAGGAPDPWVRALTETPLRLFWAGEVAVAVFFVLSGYVLARPFLAGGTAWRTYYPKRLLRLYVPVWAAIALAVLIVTVVPRTAPSGRSWWVDAQAGPLTQSSVLRNLVLLTGPDQLDNPLWSLRWEVVFSLALPLYIAAVVALRRYPFIVGAATMLVLTFVGVRTQVDELRYLPVFGLGVLLADREAELATLSRSWGRVVWPSAGAVVVLLMTVQDYTYQVVGAAIAVGMVVLGCANRALTGRIPRWLGRVSFSLYLVHVPLVVALSALLPSVGVALLLPMGLAVALASAAAFHYFVEAPSQRLASRVGLVAPRVRSDSLSNGEVSRI